MDLYCPPQLRAKRSGAPGCHASAHETCLYGRARAVPCCTVSDFCARRDAPSSRNALTGTMNQMCGLKALTAKRGHVETTPNTPRLFHSTYLRPHGLAGPQTPSITQHVHVLEPGYWLHLHVPSYRTERPHFAFSSKVTVLGKFPKICSSRYPFVATFLLSAGGSGALGRWRRSVAYSYRRGEDIFYPGLAGNLDAFSFR